MDTPNGICLETAPQIEPEEARKLEGSWILPKRLQLKENRGSLPSLSVLDWNAGNVSAAWGRGHAGEAHCNR